MDESQDCGSNVIIICLLRLSVLIWLFSTNCIVLVWSCWLISRINRGEILQFSPKRVTLA